MRGKLHEDPDLSVGALIYLRKSVRKKKIVLLFTSFVAKIDIVTGKLFIVIHIIIIVIQ